MKIERTYSVTVPDMRVSITTEVIDGREVVAKVPVDWIAARGLQLCFFAVWLVARHGRENVEIRKIEAA